MPERALPPLDKRPWTLNHCSFAGFWGLFSSRNFPKENFTWTAVVQVVLADSRDIMNKKECGWYEQIFEELDFEAAWPANLRSPANWDDCPKWLVNVSRELMQQSLPFVPVRRFGTITPETLGTFLGQHCANLYAIGDMLEAGASRFVKEKAVVSAFQKHGSEPPVASALEAIKEAVSLLVQLEKSVLPGMESLVNRAFTAALNQTNREEAAEFFRGFARGISKPGLSHGPSALSTTATPIYQRLFFHWKEIGALGSVSELRQLLLREGLSEQTLGQPKRLEKLCERIGLTFRSPGRPARMVRNNSDTVSG